jgi:hypothetical protein
MPVFLLDHGCASATHQMAFSVDNPSLRPGLMFSGTSDLDYLGVTLEDGHLVLARYERGGRSEVARAGCPKLSAGALHILQVTVQGTTVRARVWPSGGSAPAWQLTGRAGHIPAGTPGVLLVHPTDHQPATLLVRSYALHAAHAFLPTSPTVTVTTTGVTLLRPDGRYDVRMRAISAFPARITFHVARAGGTTTLPALDTPTPPYGALAQVTAEPGERVTWQAELESLTSGAKVTSAPQEVIGQRPQDRLVLFATSCEQFSGVRPSRTYAALDEAAPVRPASMVFQGDLGYANNIFHSCYLSAPDFFADRFRRILGGHDFAVLRSRVPTGFTIDDHDYGPTNNADRTDYAHWAPPLWGRIHADPDPKGYFDFRFGDTHCLTLDVRRYADPVSMPDKPNKTRIGEVQFAWMQSILESSDAKLFVIFSAGIFASRYRVVDCWLKGYPHEYDRAMRLFMSVQERGKRVLILSGDAHGMRIHYHPYPQRVEPHGAKVIEFICSGVRPRVYSGADLGDPTVDPRRNVMGRYGGGMVNVDPPSAADRRVTLSAVSGDIGRPGNIFPPLVLPFQPV